MCVGGRGHRVAVRLRGDLWFRRWPSLWAPGFILSAKGAPDRRSRPRGRVGGKVGPGIPRLSSRGGVGCNRGRQRFFAYLPRAENAAERGLARWQALVAREDRSWRGASNALATWGRSAARRSGAAMRSEVASIRVAVGSAKAGRSGIARSKGCSYRASVANGGSERFSRCHGESRGLPGRWG